VETIALSHLHFVKLTAPEPAGHGQRDPEQRRKAELKAGASHSRIVAFAGLAGTNKRLALALLPPARDAGGMAKPFAKLVKLLTPKRRWAQFSLFTMFVVVTVLCVWLSVWVHRARRQKEVVATIRRWGGIVRYDFESPTYEEPSWRSWFREKIGDDYVAHVTDAMLPSSRAVLLRKYKTSDRLPAADGPIIDDAAAQMLAILTHLQRLGLDGSEITDVGMAEISRLTDLNYLCLDRTDVTDAGIVHLAGLTNLKELGLNDTEISDEGLKCVGSHISLQWLRVTHSRITDAGLAHLQRLKNLRGLSLSHTQVSDAGLIYLTGLANLRKLSLDGTRVTDVGLAHLQGMTGLKDLYLFGTGVTVTGMTELQEALPNCQITR
jgi:hypothetical protein